LWTYSYDTSNDLTTITNPRSYMTTILYGWAGRAYQVNRPDGLSEVFGPLQLKGLVQPGQGTQSNPAAPTIGALARGGVNDARGDGLWRRLDWLGFGRATQEIEQLSDTTTNYRDANGLPCLVSDPLGHRTRTFLVSNGNPTTIVVPDDNTQKYTYNSFNEPLTYTDPTNYVTTYNYDSNGNLTKITDALNDVTTNTYNSQGFQLSRTDALNHTTS